jgi:hypothetical protein
MFRVCWTGNGDELVKEAALRNKFDEWSLPSFELKTRLAVPSTGLLTLVTAPGSLAQAGPPSTAETFLLASENESDSRATGGYLKQALSPNAGTQPQARG